MLLLTYHRPPVLKIAQDLDKHLVLVRLVYQAVVNEPDVITPVSGADH
jgi:hypothetical protein